MTKYGPPSLLEYLASGRYRRRLVALNERSLAGEDLSFEDICEAQAVPQWLGLIQMHHVYQKRFAGRVVVPENPQVMQ